MVNSKALKARLVELDMRIADVAEAIGKTYATARNKLCGATPFTVYEAELVQNLLNIPDEEFCYFFMAHSRKS